MIRALWGSGDAGTVIVVQDLRLPRALVGLLVGVAFGVSGAVFQTMTRNPLASPDMIGLTEGAGTAVVAAVVLGWTGGLGLSTLGLLGALTTALLVYVLAWKGGATGYRIILVGIGVSWICSSATNFLVARGNRFEAEAALGWLVGNLNGRTWSQVDSLAIALAVLLPVTLGMGRWMRTLMLGDDVAAGLGTPSNPCGWRCCWPGWAWSRSVRRRPVRWRSSRWPVRRSPSGWRAPRRRPRSSPVSPARSSSSAPTSSPARRSRGRNCRSGSSPAPWARRSCCGCSSAPTARALEADRMSTTDPRAPRTSESPASGPELRARDLHLAYDGRAVVENLNLTVPTGRITAIVGANACGKSTLLRALARLLAPREGVVELDGVALRSVPTRELARKLGILPQTPVAPEGLTVLDLVGRGRSPHQTWWRQWSAADEDAVNAALEATSLTDLAERPVDELSGGQRQRAWIAMAVAQGTPVLLLDEPTTYLDLAHQIDVLDLITDLNRREGRTVVMVLHDLNQACRYADHVIAMKGGRIVAEGAPSDVVTEETVEDVFDLRCRITPDPVSGTPLVIPLGRHHHDGTSRTEKAVSTR